MSLLLRKLPSRNISYIITARSFSQQKTELPSMALTKDESTFVCWHKQQDFPYECTKPLPEVKIEETDTVLKTQLTPDLLQTLNKKDPHFARLELMSITHTTKHCWFPKRKNRKAKDPTVDRKYL